MKSTMKDKMIRFLYGMFFVAIWLATLYYILGFTTQIYDSGSSFPIGNQVVPYNIHGEVVYITAVQNFLLQSYGLGVGVSLFAWIMAGTILQGVYKVEIFRTAGPWNRSSKLENSLPEDAKKTKT